MWSLILSFVIGFCFAFVAYNIGEKQGEKRGVEKFLSVLKVYNMPLVKQIADTLHMINNMPTKEKFDKFRNHVETYMKDSENDPS